MEEEVAFSLEWDGDDDQEVVNEEIIHIDECEHEEETVEEYLVGEEIIPSNEINSIPNSLDHIAAENLIYMAQDGNVAMGDLIEEQVQQVDNVDYNEEQFFECQVTEEVITDDWVQQQGDERVEIPVDQLCVASTNRHTSEIDVPLPTDQDEYTTSRPYPCDFCSRRFRKKANLMNHMVAHQNDRPHVCNLCGARYIRRCDLLNHLKIHAYVPENSGEQEEHLIEEEEEEDDDEEEERVLEEDDGDGHNLVSSIHHTRYSYATPEDIDEMAPRKRTRNEQRPRDYQSKKSKSGDDSSAERAPKFDYVNVDMRLLSEAAQRHDNYGILDRYPITDPKKPFVCQHCGVSFAREKALASHSRVHGGDSPFECDTCSEMFWDISLLQEHLKIHHPDQASNSEYEPVNEEESESEIDSKYGDFYCEVCGMTFHRYDILKRHSKTHINKDLLEGDTHHCCNVCGETFAEALDLLAHAEVHARYQTFKCMLCGESFIEESSIKFHLSSVHNGELTSNSCRLCGKLCRDSRALMKHAWDHSREKNHSCSKCGKTFHNKARLKRHMVSHRNKSVTCDVCNEEFPDGRSLMNHRHSHTNVSGRQFPCRECGKTFGSRSSQQIHIRIHTGERPYGCRFCWKAFADGGTLRKHERIHTGEKPYVCSVCPRAFNQRVVLREHIRSHHSAPDTKRGNSMTPYYCTVCGELFAAPIELIQHLIQHSDINTAEKRMPPTGPRKYKRRRKLKPHELERLRAERMKNSDAEYSDENVEQQTADNKTSATTTDDRDYRANVDSPIVVKSSTTTSTRSRSAAATTASNAAAAAAAAAATTTTTASSSSSAVAGSTSTKSRRAAAAVATENNRKQQQRQNHDNNDGGNNRRRGIDSDDDGYNAVLESLDNSIVKMESTISTSASSSYTKAKTQTAAAKRRATTKQQQQQQQDQQQHHPNNHHHNHHTELSSSPAQSRPKMIHTQKTRVPVEDGKRKTKTLIMRSAPADYNSTSATTSAAAALAAAVTERAKSRTKNINHHLLVSDKLPSAIFDDGDHVVSPPHRLSQRRDIPTKYNSDIVSDLELILRSPDRSPPAHVMDGDETAFVADDIDEDEKRHLRRSLRTPPSKTIKLVKSSLLAVKSATVTRNLNQRRVTRASNLTSPTSASLPSPSPSPSSSSSLSSSLSVNVKLEKNQQALAPPVAVIGGKRQNVAATALMHGGAQVKIKMEKIMHDDRYTMPGIIYKCEMCAAVFEDRAQLLLHVPIHI